ncbi:MAG: transposase [Pontibacterium sp.]
MMTRARREQVSLLDTPYYHCVARCVRRAFLCGEDRYSGQSYEHRRQWILDRMVELDTVFAIDICAYAIMSNHYHLVFCVNQAQALGWSDDEVMRRWTLLFTGPVLIQRYLQGGALSPAELVKVSEIVSEWRVRLSDISWFMRCLNEFIARQANREDGCTGRFWEGRFKSQALLDEQALLTCMAYVDLNPVRATLADSPESSDFTSIQQRIREYGQLKKASCSSPALKALMPEVEDEPVIPFDLADYFALVDWTGRICREDKRGYITSDLPPILHRLGIDPDQWLRSMQPKGLAFTRAIGRVSKLKQYADQVGSAWVHGILQAKRLYPSLT